MERSMWSDTRLDERFDSIDKRFDAIDRRFDRVERELLAMRAEIGALQRTIIQVGGGLVVAVLGIILTLAIQL
jgi:hypothetical protein